MFGAYGYDCGLKCGNIHVAHIEGRLGGVGAHKYHRRIGQELHDHAHVLSVLREHHWRERYGRAPRRMRLAQQLTRCLAKVFNLTLECLLGDRVLDTLQINGALICKIIKHITIPDRFWTPLLVSKYQIDPLMDLTRHKLRLQCHAVDAHEIVRVLGPLGQLNVVHQVVVLRAAHVKLIQIEKHLGQVEKLRYKLLHVRGVALTVLPRC